MIEEFPLQAELARHSVALDDMGVAFVEIRERTVDVRAEATAVLDSPRRPVR